MCRVVQARQRILSGGVPFVKHSNRDDRSRVIRGCRSRLASDREVIDLSIVETQWSCDGVNEDLLAVRNVKWSIRRRMEFNDDAEAFGGCKWRLAVGGANDAVDDCGVFAGNASFNAASVDGRVGVIGRWRERQGE
jgi:hypothetical protein